MPKTEIKLVASSRTLSSELTPQRKSDKLRKRSFNVIFPEGKIKCTLPCKKFGVTGSILSHCANCANMIAPLDLLPFGPFNQTLPSVKNLLKFPFMETGKVTGGKKKLWGLWGKKELLDFKIKVKSKMTGFSTSKPAL